MAQFGVPGPLKIGCVSISDRASSGVYQDQGLPALRDWFAGALTSPWSMATRLIPDERAAIEQALIELVDVERCHLVITTGGTGPARRDVTPEATLAVASKVLPGFGEQMRQISLRFVPTAILSRQIGVVREVEMDDVLVHAALILNLPGQPRAIKETLEGLKDKAGQILIDGIFAAVPYCIDLIAGPEVFAGGPYVTTDEKIVKAFRPKSALRTPSLSPNSKLSSPSIPLPEGEGG